MAPVYIDRSRAARLMREAGLDALVMFQPENVAYVAGVSAGVAGHFRKAGAAAALVPADLGLTLAIVMPDLVFGPVRAGSAVADVRYHPIWVGTMTARGSSQDAPLMDVLPPDSGAPQRPETFDPQTAYHHLRDQLTERGLARSRLGLDLSFVSAVELERLRTILVGATLVDATEVIGRLKMVKSAAEVQHLRNAVQLSEAGLTAIAEAICPGLERAQMSEIYSRAVFDAARARGVALTGKLDFISVGPEPWGAAKPLGSGDIIRLDIAALVAGYSSDMARTWVFGAPSRAARELHAALLGGLEAGLSMLRAGVALRDLYALMHKEVTARGVAGYRRGHFGHGVGHDVFGEEWPFISANSTVIAEPGMVLAVETPLYVDGLGGFIVEDQVLVTETGIDNMSSFDRSFRRFD